MPEMNPAFTTNLQNGGKKGAVIPIDTNLRITVPNAVDYIAATVREGPKTRF